MTKKTIFRISAVILLSILFTLLSLSPHGGVLYFIWAKYYRMTFVPLFIYYLITVSLLFFIFGSLKQKVFTARRKVAIALSILIVGTIFTFTSALVPVKVQNLKFSHARGFPAKFYLPTEDYRVTELLHPRITNKSFPKYYLFPVPQEYVVRILYLPFIADVLFYSLILLLLQNVLKVPGTNRTNYIRR